MLVPKEDIKLRVYLNPIKYLNFVMSHGGPPGEYHTSPPSHAVSLNLANRTKLHLHEHDTFNECGNRIRRSKEAQKKTCRWETDTRTPDLARVWRQKA